MRVKAFVDFDGTITDTDIGNALFERFGGDEATALVTRYRNGEIGAVECFRGEAEAMGSFDRNAVDAFIDAQRIDPSFPPFLAFCQEGGIDVRVLSDGLDLYIRRVFANAGLEHMAVSSNTAEMVRGESGWRMHVDFPWRDSECIRCACCKRNLMLNAAGEGELIVYVGDGFSDRCPARYADIVFARGTLQHYCQQENISYHLFSTFDDIVRRLGELTARKRLRPRRQAEHLRRALFVAEGSTMP